MKSVAYFDMNRTNLKRYPLWIAQQVQELSPGTATHFIYDEECKTSEGELLQKTGFPVTLHKAWFPSQRAVEYLFESVRPDLLVVTAQRLPDTVLVAHAKKVGIPSVMFQHGLYIPFMKRTWSLFAQRLGKTSRYVGYVRALSGILKVPFPRLLEQYTRVFVFGSNYRQTIGVEPDRINTDHVYVIGDYWKRYHFEQFGYPEHNQTTVGYPDLMRLQELMKEKPRPGSVCYICQTLVEDGRLPQRSYRAFLRLLKQACDEHGFELLLKLHQRTRMEIYSEITDPNTTVIANSAPLPLAEKYVGHYSTYLSLPGAISSKILLMVVQGTSDT